MFLGQESKYNGKFRAADSKNLPKPWFFFHQKSSKIIDFSWFSLSELPYSKSQQPTCLPRGRWRRRRNLRRVPTTELDRRCEDRKEIASPTEIGSSPRFWASFFWKVNRTSIDLLEKWSDKKKRTDLIHTISGPMRCGPGPGFGQLNVRYQSQNPSKVVPKTSSGSLLRTRLMSTSGLLRSLALSSSCACGAKTSKSGGVFAKKKC